MSEYKPGEPMMPLWKEIYEGWSKDRQQLDPTHPLQCIKFLDKVNRDMAWIIHRLVAERDAELQRRITPAAETETK